MALLPGLGAQSVGVGLPIPGYDGRGPNTFPGARARVRASDEVDRALFNICRAVMTRVVSKSLRPKCLILFLYVLSALDAAEINMYLNKRPLRA